MIIVRYEGRFLYILIFALISSKAPFGKMRIERFGKHEHHVLRSKCGA